MHPLKRTYGHLLLSIKPMTDVHLCSNPPWWHRRTRLERILCVLVFLAVLLSITLIALLATISITTTTGASNSNNKCKYS